VNFADAFVCKRCNHQLQNYPQMQNFPQTPNQGYGTYGQTAPVTSYRNQPQATTNSGSGDGLRKMFIGALWAIGGTIATLASYDSAKGGGRYFIFWGAILFGVIDFLRGLNDWVGSKD
jgi:hypothetical protein